MLFFYSQNEQEFNNLVEGINACRPQCPVGLTTLVLPSKSHASPGLDKQPFVYIKCGHVHGRHTWGQKDDDDDKRTCPLCLKVSNIYIYLLRKICMLFYPL